MSGKIVNSCKLYRPSAALKAAFRQPQTSPDTIKPPSMASIMRVNPHYLSLPSIALPAQLDLAAVNYLREHALSSPKAIEDRSKVLTNYLWARPLITEAKIVKSRVKPTKLEPRVDSDDDDDHVSQALQFHEVESLCRVRETAVHRLEQLAIKEWKSLSYTGHTCELYLTCRLAPNFASACRVLYELRKRCPKFLPRNLFDFGSGIGTIAWATDFANTLSHVLLTIIVSSSFTCFWNLFHSQVMYDLVVSGHSLLELPGRKARLRVLANLWQRTSDFLVLFEQGTRAGFEAILEARNWLIANGGEEMHIFAPEPNEPSHELIAYLIVSRGDWRRHQIEPESDHLPRIVSYKLKQASTSSSVLHDLCLPSGGEIERLTFVKRQTDRDLYYFVKNCQPGDILPCTPIDHQQDAESPMDEAGDQFCSEQQQDSRTRCGDRQTRGDNEAIRDESVDRRNSSI